MATEYHKDLDPVSTRKQETQQTGQDALLTQARQRAADAWSYWADNINRAQASVAFNDGHQWSENARTERERDQRPMFTFNRLPQYVNRVVGDMRQNRIQINVTPASDSAEKYKPLRGSKDYSAADVMQGIIRNAEAISNAQDGYVVAGESACNAGYGWLRVVPEYLHDETFEQDLLIRPIRDIYAVLPDPAMQEEDGADMEWCFIRHAMSRDEFKARWPDARTGDIGDTERHGTGYWDTTSRDVVHVAEYYHREPRNRVLCAYADGSTGWMDEATGAEGEPVQKRKVKTWCVKVDLITAWDVLEKQDEWPDDTIPIIPVWGQTSRIGAKFNAYSLTYHAQGAQQSFNYERTSQIEVGSLAPKKPVMATPEQLDGYETIWDTRNTKNPSVLPYNPDPLAPGHPKLLEAGMPPIQHMQAAQAAAQDIESTIGIYGASLGADSQEKSGRAILAKQNEAQLGNNVYMHNLATAVRRVGKIITRVFPSYYSGPRIMRLMHEDGTTDDIPINQPAGVDPETGEKRTYNDLTVGRYDVAVTIGKAYGTQRMEDAEKLLGVVQAMPNVGAVGADLVVGAMDFAAAKPLAERLSKTVPPELRDGSSDEEPTPEQQQQEQAQQAQAQQQAQIAEINAKAELMDAQAKMAGAQADMAMAEAKKVEARAKIVAATEEHEPEHPRSMQ